MDLADYFKENIKENFKNKTLFIKLDSAALKQELSYAKEAIKEKLNQMMGKRIVEEINIK